jgi:uncharacterized membrane protein YphA (DoxX/SURF4 family)
MAIDRQGTGLAVTRIAIGTFLLFMGINKYQWFFDSSILAAQFNDWAEASTGASLASSVSRWYLSTLAMPGVALFARLVPLGEIICGVALICGLKTPLFAFIAFLMVLNFQIASGLIFRYAFLTNGYCLPVLGPTLGLAIGGVRLPWSVSR